MQGELMNDEFTAGGWREFWWIPLGMAIAIGMAVWAIALINGLMELTM